METKLSALLSSVALASVLVCQASAQGVPTFAGNEQHTGDYTPSALEMNQIKWSVSIDQNNTGAAAHYGMPVISNANTVLVPVKIAGNGFQVEGHAASNGSLLYTLSTDYVLPNFGWIPVYQPCLAKGPLGQRLYYAGAGGTLLYVDNVDGIPTPPTREVFYTDIATYTANAAAYNGSIFINTPITADSNGDVFFGFRVQGTAPAPLSTTQSGFARIDSSGNATYVLAGNAAGDANIALDSHNCAPALSNDESTLYVPVKSASTEYYAYLLGMDSTTLATKYKVFLLDARRNGNNAAVLDDSTASPMVAPDDDVYFGTFANPYNGSRGFLQHFSKDLTVEKTPGGFGWDNTAAIVPSSMVPSYTGTSSYLLFTKYNNYDITDGNGVNRVAILDPNAVQTDFHSTEPGLQEMREVLTMIGPSPDFSAGSGYPYAVREWCVNACAVNPATNSIFFDSEDGHVYRWDTVHNVLSESVTLTSGIGEPYIQSLVGPDGTVYTLNGGNLFALGGQTNDTVTLSSSAPDTRSFVLGSSVTYTATVTPVPSSGTVTFTDNTYSGSTATSATLGVAQVDPNGQAVLQTSTSNFATSSLGNHFITASFSGDGTLAPGSVTMVQKVHAASSTTVISTSTSPASFGSSVTFSVTCSGSDGGTPTGCITFTDGSSVLGQIPLDGTGSASFSTSSLSLGSHAITATYASDTTYAASSNNLLQVVQDGTTTGLAVSPTSINYGQAVSMQATVTANDGGAGTPSGTISFMDGSNFLGSSAVDNTGHASFSTLGLSVGSHSITASFSGTTGWLASGSSATVVSVTDGTSTAVSGSPNPGTFGSSVTFTAAVSASDSSAGMPVGSVTFMDGATSLGNATVDGTGHASLSTSSLAMGSHSITVTFTGTGGWLNSNGGTAESIQDGTSTTVSGLPNPSSIGQSVTFTAAVSAVTVGAGAPTGTVTFTDGLTNLGSANVDGSGNASLSTTTLSYGSHTITASFSGTGGWLASSGSVGHSVIDTTAPTVPSSVTAKGGPKKGQITVTWHASTDPDDPVANYQVWTSLRLKGTYTLLATVTSTSYVDTVKSGSSHSFYIVAVDSHGNKSAPSAKVSAKAP